MTKKKVIIPEPEPVIEEEPQEAEEVLSIEGINEEAERLLKFSSYEPEHHFWLDTGYSELNAVLGSRERGLAFGKMVELSGVKHGGKTAISTFLGGLAQECNAGMQYMDLENSRDAPWCLKLGMNLENVIQLYPKLITDKKGAIPRLQSAEELFEVAEMNMYLLQRRGFEKQFLLLDSIANITPLSVIEAGTAGQNMRTKNERAQFLSSTLPKWTGLAANYNVLVILVNQIRTRPGVVYGDPIYTTGGNALAHTCANQSRISRIKNGHLRKNGRVIGLVGKMKNTKNKVGEGSVEGETCGFSVRWDKKVAEIEVMSVEDAEKIIKGEN